MRTLIALFVLICCLSSLQAEIINVSPEGLSIQEGINSASTGDTVLVAEGTYLENIRFRGKAITLASHFILDGDTSHISKTIIDGSQPSVADSASVVIFGDGEDSTSVLCGFTITGGTGTLYFHQTLGFKRAGGGVFIMEGSAGKIEHNIIRDNRLEFPIEIWGGGICAMFGPEGDTEFNKNLIIQNNLITKNLVLSSWVNNASSGGGIKIGSGNDLKYGRIIIQDNIISYNEVRNIAAGGRSVGGGMNFGMSLPTPPGEYLVRNNIFAYNKATGKVLGRGGGMILNHLNFECYYFIDLRPAPLVYNNLIHHNEASHQGGGIAVTQTVWPPCYSQNYHSVNQPAIFNNTIADNKSGTAAGVYCRFGVAVLFNNILWNDLDAFIGSQEIAVFNQAEWPYFITKHNLIQGGWDICGSYNLDADPLFETGSYELSESSPCIGKGIDSVKVKNDIVAVGDTWYYSEAFDHLYRKRPDAADRFIDMGAIESSFTKVEISFTIVNPEVTAGEPIVGSSSESGLLVLVPLDTPANHDSIKSISLAGIDICADQYFNITTDDIPAGTYWLYAITANRDISDPKLVIINPVGIQDYMKASVKIYPVPVRDFLHIESKYPVASVELIDASGRKINQYGMDVSSLDMSGFDQGIYFIRIMLDNGRICTRKLMKN